MSVRLLVLISLTASACTAERRSIRDDKKEARQEARDIGSLTVAADDYWRGVRWGELSSSAAWYEDQDVRLTWLEGGGPHPDRRYRQVGVLTVEVGPETEPDEFGQIRSGVVLVGVEHYTLPDQMLLSETIRQEWYLTEAGWWVEP